MELGRMEHTMRQSQCMGAGRVLRMRIGRGRNHPHQRVSMPALTIDAPLQLDTPKKVAIFVEPSPFSHISGMKNRFEQLIRNLRASDVNVMVVTPDPKPPEEFCGATVVNVLGFKLPFYQSPTLLLSTAISVRVFWYLWHQRPDVIHVSSPGLMVFAAVIYARLLAIPLVVSYHTHIPEYIPKYTWSGLVEPMWSIIRWCTKQSDLTLVTSAAMKSELSKHHCKGRMIDVWQRGVDTDTFNPKFKCPEMRDKMSGGHPDAPLLLYVGRLGAGPEREELEELYKDMPVTFLGLQKGEALSKAYASADIFLMPSETETLGFVVLEAMAAAVPVVAVAAGGLTDIITQPGATGLLYPPGDFKEAVRLTRELIGDSERRRQVGDAGREEVCKWGWSAATRKLREQQYMRAMRMNKGRRRWWVLALRMRLQGLWHSFTMAVANLLAWAMGRLDYAHTLRQAA